MSQPDEIGKLFVGGLSWDTTQASLLSYFSRFGEVTDCVIITNPTTGKSRGFGFVTFKDPASVELVQAGAPHMLDGKQIDPNGCNRKKVPKGSKASVENSRKKLFVGGLPSNIDEQQLKEGFSNYGKIQEVVIVYDQQKLKPRGFGFVTFESEESVEKIVKERFVLLNGKQVECKRAEARESVPSHSGAQEQGMVMLPDGSLGILASQSYLQHSGSLLTPVELASAYRGAYSDVGQVIQSATPVVGAGGVKYLAQQASAQPQYMVVGGGSGGYLMQGATGGGYLMQGGGAVTPGGVVINQANPFPGLMMAGAQSAATPGGYQVMAASGGGNYLIQAPAAAQTGNLLLPGSSSAATNQGIILQQHQHPQQTPQYVMHCPSGATILQPSLDAASHPTTYQLPHAAADLSGSVLGEGGDKVVGGSSLYAQPYQFINPYASATILNSNLTEGTTDDVRSGGGGGGGKQKETTTSSSSSSSTASSIPKLGYRILPYQSGAQLAGLSGTPHYASPLVAPDPQTALLASPYARVASTHAAHHKFHPYRR